MAPLNLLADIAGPMTRTVEDAVAVFAVVAGSDPDDPVTVAGSPLASHSHRQGQPAALSDYSARCDKDGLKGARIGVLRQAYERDTTDPEIVKVFTAAVEDMQARGRDDRRSRARRPRRRRSGRRAPARAAVSSTT